MYVETSIENSFFFCNLLQELKKFTQSELKVFKMNDDKSEVCKRIYCTGVSVREWSEKVKEKFVAIHID
jgi:hypothetical protein